MAELNPVVFDLLIGERVNQSGSGICVVQDIKLDLIDLGKEPFSLKKSSVSHQYLDGIDIVTIPMLWDGRPVVMTVSPGGQLLFLDYNNLEKIDNINLGLNSNFLGYHGVEAIGENSFAIAISNYKGEICLVDKKGKVIWQEVFPGAHQVVWDSTTERLFALGKTELRVYQLTEKYKVKRCGTVDFSELYTEIYNDRADEQGQNWADGGHDLYFDAGNRKMFLTTGERVYSFCIVSLLSQFSHSDKIVWKLNQLFSFNAINPVKSMYQVRSVLSDEYIQSDLAKKEWRPPNKSGCKALSRVPGSSLIVSHCAPDYYGNNGAPYATNTLMVSRGDEDLPNLYSFTPNIGDYSSLKILSCTLGDNQKSLTYRCRIKPKLPLSSCKKRELDVSSVVNLTFKGGSGGLGKVGGPYIQLIIKGEQQKKVVQKLYDDFHATRSSADSSRDAYGFCLVDIDGVINEAVFKVYISLGDVDNGCLVSKELNLYLVVYIWAEPVQLSWQRVGDLSLYGQLIDMRNMRELDALWVSVNGEKAVDMSASIDSDKRRFTINLDNKYAGDKITSLALYAMSDEGYLVCSGERQFILHKDDSITGKLEVQNLHLNKNGDVQVGEILKAIHDVQIACKYTYQWQYQGPHDREWKNPSKTNDSTWGKKQEFTPSSDYGYEGDKVRVVVTVTRNGSSVLKESHYVTMIPKKS